MPKPSPPPAPAAKAPSPTKTGEKGAVGVGVEGPAGEVAKGEVPLVGAEALSPKPVQPATRLGRADYRPPEQFGPAANPFVPLVGERRAVEPSLQAIPAASAPERFAPVPEVPPPFAGPQAPQGLALAAVGAPGGMVTVSPVAKRRTFLEPLEWPGGVPGRPSLPRVSLPLSLRGTVVGDRPCAIVWDGQRSRVVGEGESLTIQGHKVVFREIGKGYAQVVYDHKVRTLKLREET